MKQEIKKCVCDILSNNYKINVSNKNERILLNANKIFGIDIFYIIYTLCSKYNMPISKLSSFNDDITINNLTDYIYIQILQTKGLSSMRKEELNHEKNEESNPT
ncbi:MAG: hypothetical protein KIC77_06755 [Clostridiales bacterium]|nr:hypothetical protein [Clostridiales bacterium]